MPNDGPDHTGHTAPSLTRSAPPKRPRLGRRLELWFRSKMVPLLASVLRLRDRLPRRPRRPGPERVLFLRPDRIGDMIVSTGILRAIGSTPNVVLDVLAAPANASVLLHEPAVREVLVLDRRSLGRMWQSIRAMRQRHYDVVVDCMPTAPSTTTLVIMIACGARRRVGTTGRGLDAILSPATRTLPLEAHIVDHLACLVDAFRTDAHQLNLRPQLVLTDNERAAGEAHWPPRTTSPDASPALRLLVNISAGKASRRWPLEHYATVIAAARELAPDLALRIISAPNETERAHALAVMTNGTVVETRALRDAFALVAAADVLFTPDTSIAHAAAAFQVPTVDMLLVGKASGWGLYHSPGINLESPDESLASLDVSIASDALQRVMAPLTSRPTAS